MSLLSDVRFALRVMWKARWFTLAAAIPLALGIGANTTVFTLVNAVLLRGLPFEDPDRIVSVWEEPQGGGQMSVSYPTYRDWRDGASSFAHMSALLDASVNLSDDEHAPERTEGSYVSWEFFRMIGVEPVIGRGFVVEDDVPGAEPVVVIGHSIWVNRYGSDPDVLGTTVRVNSRPATVIGVMGPDMRFPENRDVWIPRVNLPPASNVEDRGTRNFQVIGRLSPNATEERAREELGEIARGLAEAYPETAVEGARPNLASFQDLQADGEIRIVFLALMGAVAFVLLIACANVANLLLARSQDRAREMAVRVSLGATRWRIVRQLLIESVLLSCFAGAIGFGLSIFGIRWFDAVTRDPSLGKPYWMVFTLDGIVFAFMAAVCLGAAVMFGLAPAAQVSKTDVNEVLKEGTRGGSGGVRARRWAGALVVGEVVLTLVLLSGAGFMMRSFLTLYSMDVAIETEDLVSMQLYLPLTQYPVPGPRAELYRALEDRLAVAPGIQAFSISTGTPLDCCAGRNIEVDGRPLVEGEPLFSGTQLVSSGYFQTFGIQFVQGRPFGPGDGLQGSAAAVVSQRFVDALLGGGNAIGRMIRAPSSTMTIPADSWFTIVGVVEDLPQDGESEESELLPMLYLPLQVDPVRTVTVVVRSSEGPGGATTAAQGAMNGVNPDLPFYEVMTMDEVLAMERWPFRVFGLMFSAFAGIALVLSAVGVYSVTAYSVAQRTRELGIRTALGAHPSQLLKLVVRKSIVHLAIGVPIGLLGAVGVGVLLQSLLIDTSPAEPSVLGAIVLLLVIVTVVACLPPARRASRVDPMVALRVE